MSKYTKGKWIGRILALFKKEQSKKQSYSYDPYEDMSEREIEADLLYGNFHEECGDR